MEPLCPVIFLFFKKWFLVQGNQFSPIVVKQKCLLYFLFSLVPPVQMLVSHSLLFRLVIQSHGNRDFLCIHHQLLGGLGAAFFKHSSIVNGLNYNMMEAKKMNIDIQSVQQTVSSPQELVLFSFTWPTASCSVPATLAFSFCQSLKILPHLCSRCLECSLPPDTHLIGSFLTFRFQLKCCQDRKASKDPA